VQNAILCSESKAAKYRLQTKRSYET